MFNSEHKSWLKSPNMGLETTAKQKATLVAGPIRPVVEIAPFMRPAEKVSPAPSAI